MATLTIPDAALRELVLCAFREAELESAYDLELLRAMPSPIPEILTDFEQQYAAAGDFESLA